MYEFLLIMITLGVYGVGVTIKVTNRWTTRPQVSSEVKTIPADIVLLTVPINIGSALNPESAFRLLKGTDQSPVLMLILLFLISLIVYTSLLCYGKILHKRNQGEPFCKDADATKLNCCYAVGILFLLFASFIASL